jgi:superfamily II DNA/RNA helicase
MTNNQLKEVLSKFRQGRVNVLIATNVVEEGLDVSECNLVICMNELLNVKAFIQMKGRARQKESSFVFLCANQEFNEVEKDRKNFGVVIEQMKELAFGKDSIGGIQPEPDVLQSKTVEESDFFEVPQTGARVSLRDAKALLDVFCKAAAEVQPMVPLDPELAQRKPSKYVKDFEPFYNSKETTSDEHNKKYFLTVLFLPKTCGQFVNYVYRVNCQNGFIKKRDSENHVALLALRQLYGSGWLDDYLFPKIGSWAQLPKAPQ